MTNNAAKRNDIPEKSSGSFGWLLKRVLFILATRAAFKRSRPSELYGGLGLWMRALAENVLR
jgi:hypothetical protein